MTESSEKISAAAEEEGSNTLLRRLKEQSGERIPFTLIPYGFKWRAEDTV